MLSHTMNLREDIRKIQISEIPLDFVFKATKTLTKFSVMFLRSLVFVMYPSLM